MSEHTAPRPRRGRLLLAAVAFGTLLGVVYSLLATGPGPSGSDDAPVPAPALPLAAQEDGEEVEEEPDVLDALPVETYQVFLSRDPFRPLQPAPGDGGTDGGPTDGGTTNGDTTDGDTTDGDTTDGELPPTNGDACTGDGEVVCDGQVVTLVDVFAEDGVNRAQVQVDSTIFTVGEGDTFDESFRVLAIDPPCVTLLFGDERFTLCEGQQVLK